MAQPEQLARMGQEEYWVSREPSVSVVVPFYKESSKNPMFDMPPVQSDCYLTKPGLPRDLLGEIRRDRESDL